MQDTHTHYTCSHEIFSSSCLHHYPLEVAQRALPRHPLAIEQKIIWMCVNLIYFFFVFWIHVYRPKSARATVAAPGQRKCINTRRRRRAVRALCRAKFYIKFIARVSEVEAPHSNSWGKGGLVGGRVVWGLRRRYTLCVYISEMCVCVCECAEIGNMRRNHFAMKIVKLSNQKVFIYSVICFGRCAQRTLWRDAMHL